MADDMTFQAEHDNRTEFDGLRDDRTRVAEQVQAARPALRIHDRDDQSVRMTPKQFADLKDHIADASTNVDALREHTAALKEHTGSIGQLIEAISNRPLLSEEHVSELKALFEPQHEVSKKILAQLEGAKVTKVETTDEPPVEHVDEPKASERNGDKSKRS